MKFGSVATNFTVTSGSGLKCWTMMPRGRSGVRITDLRVEFKVEKNHSTTPNALELRIYNLGEQTAGSIQKKDYVVLLEAGYETTAELLYVGDIDEIHDEWSGPDRITTLTAVDGADALRRSRLFEGFAAGVTA